MFACLGQVLFTYLECTVKICFAANINTGRGCCSAEMADPCVQCEQLLVTGSSTEVKAHSVSFYVDKFVSVCVCVLLLSSITDK